MKAIYFNNPQASAGNSVTLVPDHLANDEYAESLKSSRGLESEQHYISEWVEPKEYNAFKLARVISGGKIVIDIDHAKEFGHRARRAKRSADFAPLDIKATIPDEAEAAEVDRGIVRAADAIIQTDMDAATTPEGLKAVMVGAGIA